MAFKAHLAVRFEEVLTLETKFGRVRIDARVARHTIVFHVTARAFVDVAPGSQPVPIRAFYPTGWVEREPRWRGRGASREPGARVALGAKAVHGVARGAVRHVRARVHSMHQIETGWVHCERPRVRLLVAGYAVGLLMTGHTVRLVGERDSAVAFEPVQIVVHGF